jgi:drug/metabolite transporter (DMT)-like permease
MLIWSKGKSYMLASTGFYAFLNLCVKKLSYLPALELLFFRSAISFIICGFGIWQAGVYFWGTNHKWLIIRGIAGVFALWLYFISIQNMPLASAVSIQYTSPVFTAILATFLLSEKMNKWKWLFFFISIVGVFLIKGVDPRLKLEFVAIGLASAIFSAVAYNAVRKLHKSEHPLVIIIYFPLLALPVSGYYCFFHWVQPIGSDWILAILMGLLTQAGQLCMTKAVQLERLENVTFLNYAGIIFALILGLSFFGEIFDWISLIGMVMVMAGIFLNLFEKKKENLPELKDV